MTSLPFDGEGAPRVTPAMAEKKPDDPRGKIWFNWPLALGLVVNVVLWAAAGVLFVFLRRR